jgi:hypothetical protein
MHLPWIRLLAVATLGGLNATLPVLAASPPGTSGGELFAGDPPGAVLAWARCQASPQTYAGRSYWWLGEVQLRSVIEAPPRAGQHLALLWGSKNDARTARLILNGQEIPLRAGGYDGFRWLCVPVPPDPTRPHTELTLSVALGSGAREAFIAELRLLDSNAATTGPASREDAAYRCRVQTTPVTAPGQARQEAFPAMRALWDREPLAPATPATPTETAFRQAEQNARLAAEAFYRCRRYVDGWLAHADPVTGLIPRNLGDHRDLWNGRDAAADNYPFMVLTCALTDRPRFEGRLLEMLRTEERVTRRLDRLGDQFRFTTQTFAHATPDFERLVFDNAEYVKDGLIPLTEWLGPSPWSDRMIGLVEDIWKHAPLDTPAGRIPTRVLEVNGDLLQACSRLYWFTGEDKYLDWAIRLGDTYLLGDQHPTRNFSQLRFSDHDCEIINGLSELYFAVSRARPEKHRAYQAPIREMFDRILEVGRNPDGLLWHTVNPQTGTNNGQLCDTWGYNYNGFYTVFLVDGTASYRDAVRHVLARLGPKYHGRPWADRSQDGIADSVEGALNLYNREPLPAAAAWIDHQMRELWACQQPDGTIERWHGDGNFARTSIMYALWKTQGLHVDPWRPDVRVGAVFAEGRLFLSLAAAEAWSGQIKFDRPRHREFLRLPADYPRINQFPEWFTVEAGRPYVLEGVGNGTSRSVTGAELRAGLACELKPGQIWERTVRALPR